MSAPRDTLDLARVRNRPKHLRPEYLDQRTDDELVRLLNQSITLMSETAEHVRRSLVKHHGQVSDQHLENDLEWIKSTGELSHQIAAAMTRRK